MAFDVTNTRFCMGIASLFVYILYTISTYVPLLLDKVMSCSKPVEANLKRKKETVIC